MNRFACVTGRFQPLHHQHMDLFSIALQKSDYLIVAITNPDVGARHDEQTSAHRHTQSANPFTFHERARLITAALETAGMQHRSMIVPFDLTRASHWHEYVPRAATHFVRAYSDWERQKADILRQGGYKVELMEGDNQSRLSASDIRLEIAGEGGSWRTLVAPGTVNLIDEFLRETPWGDRV